MYRGNADKARAEAEKIATQLRKTDITVKQLMVKYHCGYSAIMKVIRSQIPPNEYKQLKRKRLRAGQMKTQFQPGLIPWNKNKPFNAGGNSVKTRFKKGRRPHNAKPLGTISIRITTRDKRGPYRMIATPGPTPACHKWIPYAQYVWEQEHGPLPKGMLVAHLDGNSMNDVPENLRAVDRAGNIELMKKNNPGYRKKAIRSYKRTVRRRRAKKAREVKLIGQQQKKLHRQTATEAEHKKLAEEMMLKLYGPQVVVWECTNCSAEYEQKTQPERCIKCGRFSFEKNIYRRKTG